MRLQFKHIAAARGEMVAELSVAAGVVAATHAAEALAPVPAPAAAPASGASGRVVLGGEDDDRPLEKAELCTLVRSLRHHDESMLSDFRRLRANATTEVASALDRLTESLLADLEKMRLLEDLARQVAGSVDTR